MMVIFGLGNPERKYNDTYHNIGFYVLETLAKKLGADFKINKCDGSIAEVLASGKKVLLVKPTTYMNLSGQCVSQVLKKYLLYPKDIIVLSDDIDLPKGKFRFRENGSGGTHNGLKNIVQCLGTTDFQRLRIGIGRPENNIDLADYVLSKIDKKSMQEIDVAVNEVVEFLLKRINPNVK